MTAAFARRRGARLAAFGRAILLALTAMLWVVPPALSGAPSFDTRRFVNLTDWFTWPRFAGFDKPGVLWPAYDPARHARGREALAEIKRLGFRGVRLGVDPAPFWALAEPQRAEAFGQVLDAVDRALGLGLSVIVDLHPNSRHAVYGERAVIGGLDQPVVQSYLDVVEAFALRLSSRPANRVALELMNEPRLQCRGVEQDRWNAMLDAMFQRARRAAATLPLVVTGACISAIEGLLALDPGRWRDPGLIYTFHYYEPFVFTHQGAPFIRWPEKHLEALPWPPRPVPDVEPAMRKAEQSLASVPEAERDQTRLRVRAVLLRYLASGADERLFEQRFAELAAWAERHGVPANRIFLGEFGVFTAGPGRRGADCADRARWTEEVRRAAEKRGFGWAFFHYDGPFGFHDRQSGRQDRAVLAALGLADRGGC